MIRWAISLVFALALIAFTFSEVQAAPIVHMQDTTATFGLRVNSERPIQGEFVSSSSQLVGDQIDSITLKLKKTGSPTGTAQIGVFGADLSVKQLFGTQNAGSLTSSYTEYTYSLSNSQSYVIQSGDIIGIKFTGGNSNNRIAVMTDQDSNDPFDGIKTYHTYYTKKWNNEISDDLYMILKFSNNIPADTTAPITSIVPAGGTYTSAQSVTLAASEPATIYYTKDGSNPTTSSSTYSSQVSISANTTLKFFAKDTAGNSEAIKTETYTIDSVLPVTAASPPGGVYPSAQSVTLAASEPATIYYTTDGSTPTTSSTVYDGRMSISTTTTLKFFAKDTAGNLETVKTLVYTINADTVAPTTTASPAGGTYTSAQSVTLAASEPATIYYTKDGSNPTTSSSVYSTPISISATTALKFFAKDTAGNSEAIKTETYNFGTVTSSSSLGLDKFGVKMFYKTKSSGRTWDSTWDNGQARTVYSGDRDPYSTEFIARGDGKVVIDGNGIATLIGSAPRMYIYDSAKLKKWDNVEITFYGKRVSESQYLSYQGFSVGARSEHQDASKNACLGRTYYGKMNYDGRIQFGKEVVHHGAYAIGKPSESKIPGIWGTSDNTLPKNIWVGLKYVVRTMDAGQHVKLELYRDMTDGQNGGSWQKIIEYNDIGVWSQTDSGLDINSVCGYPAEKILLDPGTTVFIRADGVTDAEYKKWSIREIDPLP